MVIERLKTTDWKRLKKLRLGALQESPNAFGGTLDCALSYCDSDWKISFLDLTTFVAVQDGVDQGLIRCAPDRDNASSVFLISLWVAPPARRNGLAESLIQVCVEWARSEGCEQLLLDVADRNVSAIKLYSKLLFESNGETGTLPFPREHITEHRRVRKLMMLTVK